MRSPYQLIKSRYEHSHSTDSTELFQTIQDLAGQTGLDAALEILQQCVLEKRLGWYERVGHTLEKTGNPLLDGYRLFYESYLHVSVPQDGEIIELTGQRMVMRWWNRCPTLEACQKLGLDTKVVCRKVYQEPVQALLTKIDSRLRFKRNYAAIRPYAHYCEEIIEIGALESDLANMIR